MADSVTSEYKTAEANHGDEARSSTDIYFSKRRILKNVFLLGIAFLLDTTPIIGLGRMQSSLHRVDGLGVIAASVLYGTLIVSSTFLPKLLINGIGHKWTTVVGYVGYLLWVPANGCAVWGTMIPASMIVGLCSAPLWAAQCSYITIVARQYSKISNETQDAVITRLLGIFFMFFQFSTITGAIISSTGLRPDAPDVNVTVNRELCGVDDCPWYNVTAIAERPSDSTIWTMLGIYIGVGSFSVIIVGFFLDSLPKQFVATGGGKTGSTAAEIVGNLMATLRQLRHLNQLLIIPLSMYSGFEQAAFSAEWSRSYVTCGFGIWKVGLVTLPFGCVNAFVSLTFSHLVKIIGRVPVFFAGFIADLSIQLSLRFWRPSADEEYVLYILSGLWGLSDGVWETQINALYGCLFVDETAAAFSNFRLWQSLGFVIPFAYSNFLCTDVKLHILTSMLLLGMTGYVIIELRRWSRSRSSSSLEDQ